MVQGLLYVADMSYDYISVPEDKVTVGETVRCKIKAVNKARQRITFSLKLMEVHKSAVEALSDAARLPIHFCSVLADELQHNVNDWQYLVAPTVSCAAS